MFLHRLGEGAGLGLMKAEVFVFFKLISFIEVQLIYNVFLLFSDLVLFVYVHIIFRILFYYGLSWYNFLCCIVGPCCLSTLYMSLCLLISNS